MRLSGEVTEISYTKREHHLVEDALCDLAKCTCQHGVGTVFSVSPCGVMHRYQQSSYKQEWNRD